MTVSNFCLLCHPRWDPCLPGNQHYPCGTQTDHEPHFKYVLSRGPRRHTRQMDSSGAGLVEIGDPEDSHHVIGKGLLADLAERECPPQFQSDFCSLPPPASPGHVKACDTSTTLSCLSCPDISKQGWLPSISTTRRPQFIRECASWLHWRRLSYGRPTQKATSTMF